MEKNIANPRKLNGGAGTGRSPIVPVRMDTETKILLDRAARLCDVTLSQFIRAAALADANRVLGDCSDAR